LNIGEQKIERLGLREPLQRRRAVRRALDNVAVLGKRAREQRP
jgi:hypothetical protein